MAEEQVQTADEKLEIMRHSAAHIMAEAVLTIFPEAKFGIGPTIEDGFYYDFDLPRALTPEDLPVIEAKMKEIVKSNSPFIRERVSKEEARRIFAGQPYKLELIDELTEEEVTIYKQGNFTDMCRGPHVKYTSAIKAFKLMSIAGAYWRGDEKRPMLQRIYAIAFLNQQDLTDHLNWLEEALKRDHRRINKQLNLYTTPDELGGGLVIYNPKFGRIRTVIEDFWRREHFANGYEILYSPHIGLSKLWETSGHLVNYKENMYSPIDIDNQEYYLKPMNCPFHLMAYKSETRSYRDLPLRWAELGTVYRYERSGVLSGLLRVRGFTQDDAHIICTPEQINDEIAEVLRFSIQMLAVFGFKKQNIYVSTKPEKAIGSDDQWHKAENALRSVLDTRNITYQVDEGGGAFYGPKIDIKVEDALGREWQLSTIQFDFNLPERFGLVYTGADGKEHRPFMVHRALLGSLERFFGVLIEHFAGAFPVWISPVQVALIPVADRHNEYASQLAQEMQKEGIRVKVDIRGERMNQKIRDAQLEKIPYMLVIGDREASEGKVAVRLRTGEQLPPMTLNEFIPYIKEIISTKSTGVKL